jgi:hypothetical protein
VARFLLESNRNFEFSFRRQIQKNSWETPGTRFLEDGVV